MKRLALGTVQFGLRYGVANNSGQVSIAEAAKMLALAAQYGIDTLDTAVVYGDSETRLGHIGVAGFRLVTKLPPLPAECADVTAWARDELSASLARLGAQSVHGLLLHQPGQLLGPQGPALHRALQTLKAEGLAHKTGISIYAPDELDAIATHYPLDIVQSPFNLVDRRLADSGWLRRLKDMGVEVHTRSAYLQGLLLMSDEKRPTKFSRWAPLWNRWRGWLAQTGVSPVQACLSCPLSYPEIDRVVVGADSMAQLAQTITAANSPLDGLPDLSCADADLVNPSHWSRL